MSSADPSRRRCAGQVQARRATPLPYGEVRVDDGEVAIGCESALYVSTSLRELFDRAVAATEVDPENVLVVRVTEALIEVDAIDVRDISWPTRTVSVTAEAMQRQERRRGP